MKTILKIFAILAVIALVAGGIYLLVENTSIVNNLLPSSGGARPEFDIGKMPTRSEASEMQGRPEGGHDHHEASLTGGLTQVGKTLIKVSLITAFVLGIQFFFKQAKRLRTPKTTAS